MVRIEESSGIIVENYLLPNSPQPALIAESVARTNFTAARDDAIRLVDIHDSFTDRKSGRPPEDLESLKRASVILAVTAWESFIEDSLREQFTEKLKHENSPAAFSRAFNAVANNWLYPGENEFGQKKKPQPPDLMAWTGDGWKTILLSKFEDELEALNTPNTANIRHLYLRYLDRDITIDWRWKNTSPESAQRRLDTLIKERGRIVHRARRFHPSTPKEYAVTRDQVIKALNLIYCLMEATEVSLGTQLRLR